LKVKKPRMLGSLGISGNKPKQSNAWKNQYILVGALGWLGFGRPNTSYLDG
jgi:hypothetical protein